MPIEMAIGILSLIVAAIAVGIVLTIKETL